MSYENVLLIGGPKDGEWMSVMEGMPSIRVAVMPKMISRIHDPVHEETFEIIEYRRVQMSGDKFRGCVYVLDGVEPMSALINGYRQPIRNSRDSDT
ncbi:hypothetical protein [Pseudomonas sp.]|uniref:hypothetical protein n=1 Tax=Pseudomonas sp. TaxID=306 RepID=UPI003FD7B760